jgi:hypothetical protein
VRAFNAQWHRIMRTRVSCGLGERHEIHQHQVKPGEDTMSTFRRIGALLSIAPALACGSTSSANIKITPLPDESFSGASCALLTPKGRVLTDGHRIIINGQTIRTGKPTYSKNTKTWTANGLEIIYLAKGKLLEDSNGFTPGESKVGLLKVKRGQEMVEIPAKEACEGDV